MTEDEENQIKDDIAEFSENTTDAMVYIVKEHGLSQKIYIYLAGALLIVVRDFFKKMNNNDDYEEACYNFYKALLQIKDKE
jgi:hypothetical protein